MLEVHGGMGHWGSWGTFALFCVLKALHLALFSLLAAVLLGTRYAIPAIAALWTGIERTHGTFGFAWLTLGNAGIDMPLPLRVAPFVGVYGISFLFALMSAVVAFLILRRGRKKSLLAGHRPRSVAAARFAAARNARRDRAGGSAQHAGRAAMDLRVVRRGTRSSDQESLEALVRGLRAAHHLAGKPGPALFLSRSHVSSGSDAIGSNASTPIFFSEPWLKRRRARRSIRPYCCGPTAQLVDRYDKINLVPFGEFVPRIFGFVNRITQEAGDFAPGNRIVVFPMGRAAAGRVHLL